MTRTEKLKSIFPDLDLSVTGHPMICPLDLIMGYREKDECRELSGGRFYCPECIKEFWNGTYIEG